jgi:hypothetical protein
MSEACPANIAHYLADYPNKQTGFRHVKKEKLERFKRYSKRGRKEERRRGTYAQPEDVS